MHNIFRLSAAIVISEDPWRCAYSTSIFPVPDDPDLFWRVVLPFYAQELIDNLAQHHPETFTTHGLHWFHGIPLLSPEDFNADLSD